MIGRPALHLPLQFLTSQIAIIVILDNACLFHASQARPDYIAALDRAYSRYKTSDTRIAARIRFSSRSVECSIPKFTEFILAHRIK